MDEQKFVIMSFVAQAGMPIPNFCLEHKKHEDVALLVIDMYDKRGKIVGCGSDDDIPMIMIEKCDNDEKDYKNILCISFPEYQGWNIWSINISKYSIFIAMGKDDD